MKYSWPFIAIISPRQTPGNTMLPIGGIALPRGDRHHYCFVHVVLEKLGLVYVPMPPARYLSRKSPRTP